MIILASALALAGVFICCDSVSDSSSVEAHTVTFDANGGSGGYSIAVLPNAVFYMPTASLASAEKSGCGLVGWTCDGVFYEIGQEATASTDLTFKAVWVSGSVDEMQMGTWSSTVTKEVFSEYQEARVKSCSVTVTDTQDTSTYSAAVSGNTSYILEKATVTSSFTPAKTGTYKITVSYTVRFSWGDDPEQGIYGEYSFGSQEEKSYTDTYTVTFTDATKTSKQEVTWTVGDTTYTSQRFVGDTLTVPYAGALAGTDDLAWWTADYYGTGDIYILPGTRIPVELGKNLDFKAKMSEPGYGAIGYAFEGGTSTTVQIAYAYQMGSEVTLPSDVTLEGCQLAGWTLSSEPSVIYLPGTVIGTGTEDGTIADTDVQYIEMHAYWVKDGETCHKVTFQNSNGVVVSSSYVPDGAQVVLPVYGFATEKGEVAVWTIGEEEYDPGTLLTVTGDIVADAGYTSGPQVTTCTVVYISGGATSSMTSKTYELNAALELPDVDRAYYALIYWYDASGEPHRAGEILTSGLVLYAKWVKVFTLSVSGTDASVKVLLDGNYSTDWGSGRTSGTGLPENSSGVVTVTMLSGEYEGTTAWAIYHTGSGSSSGETATYEVTFVDNGKVVAVQTVEAGESASKLSGSYSYYTDTECTKEYSFGAVNADTTVYVKETAGTSSGIEVWHIVLAAVAVFGLILIVRRVI